MTVATARLAAASVGLGLVPGLGIAQVSVSGVEDAMLENVLIHLALDDEPCDAPEWRIRERFSRAGEDIRAALEAFGFYAIGIQQQLEIAEPCWTASFEITLGEPVRLRNVDVEIRGAAADDPVFERLVQGAALVPGEPLRHAAYERLKRRLLELAQQRGYADAALTRGTVDVYPDAGVADIVLHFESGPRYRFGEITFSQDALDRSVLDGYYDFRRGDPYDRTRLTAFYAALADSGYFSTVDVRPLQPDSESREIPVQVSLTSVPQRAISYGLGFSTDTGPRFRFGRVNRLVNPSGAQADINGQLSPVISEIGFSYRFPYGDPRTEWMSFDVGLKSEETETAASETIEFGVRRVISRDNGWQETQFVDVTVEDFEVAATKRRSRLLTPGISWLRVQADSGVRPTRGYRLGLELSGANEELGSDTSFLQADATARWIRSFANESRLLLRARLGFTWHSEFVELPPSVRFFAGGDNSIRGFKFESLGPVDADGEVIGGDRLAVASIEYEFPIRARWSGAVFADSGNAFTGSEFEARTGAGFGLRWQSPLGPIRFDVAWPVDEVEDDPRLHISLGADL